MKATRLVCTAIALITSLSSSANATVLGSPIVNPVNNHSYYLLAPADWLTSQSQAVALGGNLVTINDAAEDAWIYSTFGGEDRPLWLGLTDQASEGSFNWISGESFSYVNWSWGEPNNGAGTVPNENYVYMIEANPAWPDLNPGRWNDVPVDGEGIFKPVFGVVEVVPEPSIITLGLVGLSALWFGPMKNPRQRRKSAQSALP
jgi:hypothetical protein